MINAVSFAEVGADLLRLTAMLARATQGRFDGAASVVLDTTATYAGAAANAFSALAVSGSLTEEQRVNASSLASSFRNALGGIATHFRTGAAVRSLRKLGELDHKNPNQDRLAAALQDEMAGLVAMSATAREALEFLQRDPLDLVSVPPEALLATLGEIAAGVTVRMP